MKRSWKTLLATCAIAVTALIAPGIQSKAATSVNMGVHQTDADSDSVEIAWNAQLGYKDYHIEMSTDNRNWTDMDYSYSPSESYQLIIREPDLLCTYNCISGLPLE